MSGLCVAENVLVLTSENGVELSDFISETITTPLILKNIGN